ncbi:Transcriptional regulator, AbiEi antitoxin, Type IV TA system [Micromonospora pattaloongensis]|uniref:Transcriptional regulator, AbiEi antitoxin, Type IV TA system n=1 Tax=Micromonospora pattaloongensis TaxID=405436 RepID=A0A1H3I7S7_9ACTN|nr:type IV toxin-antitoxin system AbiEi family antitoxin domain-containing protein [Micromonospora pattaloongensis]SDY23188.1 Transcriptional regulator, AbiEi antitoxin, Type IV TA system [Micromonospora pattaloongensis]
MDAQTLIRGVAAGQDGVVTLAQARDAGLRKNEVDSLCRSGRWRRLALGTYLVDAHLVPDVPRRARIRAAVTSLGPRAVAVLDTAAELYGIAGLRPTPEIHVSVPVDEPRGQRFRDPSVVVHQLTLQRSAIAVASGIPATTPVRTVADVILRADRLTAVSAIDSALNSQLLAVDDLAVVAGLIGGRRGAVAARGFLTEADPRAQSPLETRVRLRCADGRVPPDTLQHEIRDEDGYLLGIGDLAWLRARIVGEADGRGPHSGPEALYQDRRRQNRLVNAGWSVLRFTWSDTLRPDYIPYAVRAALAAAHSR